MKQIIGEHEKEYVGNDDSKTNLPERWVRCSLDDLILTLESGGRPKGGVKDIKSGIPSIGGEHLNDEGGFRFDRIRYIPESYFSGMHNGIIKRNDVLIVKDGATTGKTSYVDHGFPFKKAAVNEHVFILRGFSKYVEQRYLFRYLFSQEGQREIQKKFQGSAQGGINTKFIIDFPIPLSPIPEQRLIVTRVDSLLEHVSKAKESLEKIPRIMKRFRQAALKKAFSGELTAEWRAQHQDHESASELQKCIQEERKKRYDEKVKLAKTEGRKPSKKPKSQETEPLDTSDLPELPKEWVWIPLEQACQPERALTYGIIKLGQDIVGGVPTLRSSDVRHLYIDEDHVKAVSPKIAAAYDRTFLSGNEIVVTVRGTLGGVAVVPPHMKGYNVSREVAVVPIEPMLVSKFFAYSIGSIWCQNWLNRVEKGVAYTGINIADLKCLPLPVPPLPEQQEIVRRVESLFKFADETEKNAGEARRRVELMTQSILARAFRGDLSTDFREAVKNWKDLDAEARGRYIFVLPEGERAEVINGDEFPMEPASRLLERIGEERGKLEGSKRSTKARIRKG